MHFGGVHRLVLARMAKNRLRRLQDNQEAQTDTNRTPKTTPNKSSDLRNYKAHCDMMIAQKTLKSTSKTHILDIHNIVLFVPFSV